MKDQWRDPGIEEWLAEGPNQGPVQGLERALAATHRVGQRQGWTFPTWWLPWAGGGRGAARLAAVGLLLLLLALLLVTLSASLMGGDGRIRAMLDESGKSLVAYPAGSAVYVERVDGSQRRRISAPDEVARSPLFAPDGQRIAYLRRSDGDTQFELVVVALDSPGAPLPVSGALDVVASDIPSFDWSPDGTRIAFAAHDQGVTRLFVVTPDGSGLVARTDRSSNVDLPSWSHDGAWIAYRSISFDGRHIALRKVRPLADEDEDIALVIAPDAFLSRVAWSPSGDTLSYFQNVGFGTTTAAVIDLGAGHTLSPWTRGVSGYTDNGMPWSPDGQQLAILTASDGVILATMDENGPEYQGELRQLGNVADCWVDWSPDGSALYGGSPDGCLSVVVIPLRDPSAAGSLPGSTSGTASWQPLP